MHQAWKEIFIDLGVWQETMQMSHQNFPDLRTQFSADSGSQPVALLPAPQPRVRLVHVEDMPQRSARRGPLYAVAEIQKDFE